MHRHKLRLAAMAACLLAVAGCKCNSAPTREGLKPEGVPCTIDAQCETGLCDALPKAGKLCMRKCSQECRQTELCTQLGLERFGCVPEREGLCKACTTATDCAYLADACLTVGEGKFCGRDCSYDKKCPLSYECVEGTSVNGARVASQCLPISGSCVCTATSTGQTLPCEKNNDAGTCVGVRTCDPPGEYSACSAAVPLVEACNGADDDCDGQSDEELGETQCGVGECVRTFANCANGAEQACVPADAGVELCDGKDNDCDGVADNGFELVADLPDDAILDSNCDGIDGQITKAYFVDCGGGSDSAAGTMGAPFATLAHALSVAGPGKDQILVTGTCTESVTLKDGVGLYGGYSSTFTRSLATPATVSQLSGGGPAVSGTNLSQSTALDAFVVVAAPGSGTSG
ncbi:MAG: MopE-related protein, partial [Myxococcaceae bacterium]